MSLNNKETPAFLLAGGRPRDEEQMTRLLSRAFSAIKSPQVAYIGVANGDSLPFFEMMEFSLMNAGAKQVDLVPLAQADVNVEAVKQTLQSADVIFLAGGDVDVGMDWLNQHQLTGFLKDLFQGGKLFAGVSAGTIMMGSHWVKWAVKGDDTTAELFDCLGFTPRLFDVHGEVEDWSDLKVALRLMGNGARGYAIPHGGLITADSSGTLTNLEKTYFVYLNDDGQITLV